MPNIYNVGIDLSLNSTAVCIENESSYNFAAFFRVADSYWKPKNINILEYNLSCKEIYFVPIPKRKVVGNYLVQEQIKLLDIWNFVEYIWIWIRSNIPENSIIRIALEGVSYGSQGNSIVDIGIFHGMLRSALYEKVLDKDGSQFYSVPPKTLKKYATGNGNADKMKMISTFIEDDLDHPFHDVLKKSQIFLNNKQEYIKPVDDLVDAYFLAKWLSDFE